MNRNALFTASIFAIVGAALLLLYLRRFEREKSGGEPIRVLVAKKNIDRGKPLAEDMLAVREVPVAYVEDRAVKASEQEKVLGLRMGNALLAQQTLMWTDLAIARDEDRDLSSLVMPGYRAVYIRAVRQDDGSTLIRPGDYVDVIATLPQGSESEASRASVVLLQKVLVLANGSSTSADFDPAEEEERRARSASRDQGLTLSLNLQEAQLIALAEQRGQLSVLLRNIDDQRTFEAIPDITPAALSDGRARAAAQSSRRSPPGGVNTPVRLVEAPVGAAR
jgi:pilus assembly protein CpaB